MRSEEGSGVGGEGRSAKERRCVFGEEQGDRVGRRATGLGQGKLGKWE